jgi:ABC-type antimicrobial peptide transport system permease subunit
LNTRPNLLSASRAEIWRAVEVASDALRTDRVRTRSAIVALAIAMAIVVCLTTLVERGRAATIRSLERAGLANLYLVNRPLRERSRAAVPLGSDDLERLRAIVPIRAALGMRVQRRVLTARGAPFSVSLYAVRGPIAEVFHLRAGSGRMLGDLDAARKSPYCLVGSDVGKLAGFPTSVGSIVNAGSRSYEVVGELQDSSAEGASAGEIPALDWNRAIVVPLGAEPEAATEADARYPIDVAVAQFASAGEADRAASLAERMNRERYGPSGPVRIASPIQTLRQYRQTRRTFDRIVWLVCLLTALSAVLGISNLLSASVLARAREIGLRRAVGARSNDIVLQFQAEGLLLGVLGGGAGLAAGLVVGFLSLDRSGPGASLSLATFSLLAGSCAVLGILTGIRPSIRASRIDPAQALREG